MSQNGTANKVERKWARFPVHFPRNGVCSCGRKDCDSPTKHPIPFNGFHAATTDQTQIDKWWKVNPEANTGIATGTSSKLLVIDIDGDEGERSIEILQKKHGFLPATVEVATPHGRHLYFRYLSGKRKLTSTTAWLPGIDIRANGGYVVGAGSKSLDGEYRYTRSPDEIKLAAIPDWLRPMLPAEFAEKPPKETTAECDIASILIRARTYVAACDAVHEGERNKQAFKIAGHMHNKFELHDNEVFDLMHEWNDRCTPPLDPKELMQCVRSARKNGTARESKSNQQEDTYKQNGEPPHESNGEYLLSDLMPVSEFLRRSDDIRYLVPYVVVAKQGGIISGKMKNLKTTIAIDLNISMATATPFLGSFEVPSVTRCAFLCGESGEATIKADIRRIAQAKGIDAPGGEVDNLFVSSRCPRLQSKPWLDEIRRVIDKHELGCVTIDPTYLAAAGVKQNDLSAVAALLEPLNRIIDDTGCSNLLVHHNRKVSDVRYGAPTLEEITGSGYGEWARFWLLLNKRREWDDVVGQHWLWLVTGGSAGFGSRKWLDVIEGKPTDEGGRVWNVEVVSAGEGASKEKAEREQQKQVREAEQRVADRQKLAAAFMRCEGRRGTKSDLEARASMNGRRFNAVLVDLLDAGTIRAASVPRANGQSYPGYELVKEPPKC